MIALARVLAVVWVIGAHAVCEFDPPVVGEIILGVNDGGCYVCEADGEAALWEMCEQMCTADPSCKSYGVGAPEVATFYEKAWGWSALNCCVEHFDTTDPADMEKNKGRFIDMNDPSTPPTCAREAACWATKNKKKSAESTCPLTPKHQKCVHAPEGSMNPQSMIEKWIEDGCPDGVPEGTVCTFSLPTAPPESESSSAQSEASTVQAAVAITIVYSSFLFR
eukprot:gnl/TRDRNA2_/TRDRNA2_69694_c0_seq1.p1 gnl/TRDRNA2_/TRDRNA2_69694_c0~~gnl/TRDRNA2_/TRDRNA2_69694_c0_seq1.p1  ORF type:complete len:222 (-),score=36.24 gnl/TRDRNA2_/TRDRNA2_69694_c0_seq1:67-732(-)